MGITRRLMTGLVCAAGLTALAAGAPVMAGSDGWAPNKPINFIIMAGKGGGADKMARLMQSIVEKHKMSPKPLVPINKPGGSGAEALIAMKNASDPDYNIMVTLNSFFTTPLRQPKLGIDVMKFTPVGRMAEDTFLLWVHKDSGLKTFADFVKKAKADGRKWVMGGTGKAQEDEIVTGFLNANFGLNMKYIPYKGGGTVAKQLAGKQINSSVNNPSEALGFYESGDVVPLVQFTSSRLDLFKDVPTMGEAGKEFAYYMQRAVVGAPGMSAGAAKFYQDLFKKVYDSSEWQGYRKKKALVGDYLTGDALKAYWKTQRTRHQGILKGMGMIK